MTRSKDYEIKVTAASIRRREKAAARRKREREDPAKVVYVVPDEDQHQ